MTRLIGNHPKRSLQSKLIKHFKIWQKHDITAFTGSTRQENGQNIYSFKNISNKSLQDLLDSLKHTDDPNKDTTDDAKQAFPLMKFDDLSHAMAEINFQFSDKEKASFKNIKWNLEDSWSLSYTVEFESVEDEWYFLESEKVREENVIMDNSRAIYDWS
tara:strand:+ start:196 stop:672 length:477 start_codon:yes stop_codon:yes gene_type:complete